ncbi:MAG: excinuclease subunit [Bacteroidota bacterium]|jgi:excinuclease ABC subunit A
MEKFITVKGAREHNLKGLDVRIPHGKLTVITGVSGSGKSSLAFDTIFAEGQRRFIESMSAYARQFLGRLDKPAIDDIKGLSPAIAIQQKVSTGNPRSTIGTSTEIYDYLKLCYARIGTTFSPVSGNAVRQHQTKDVLDFLDQHWQEAPFAILYKLDFNSINELNKKVQLLNKEGFTRLFINENFHLIDELPPFEIAPDRVWVVIDRLKNESRELPQQSRLSEGIERAFAEGKGECCLYNANTQEFAEFNARFEADGLRFETPSPAFFAFNNPYGACKTCEGYGMTLGIDEELVFPDRSKSVYEGAIAPWKGENMQEFQQSLLYQAGKFDFPIHRPIQELSPAQYALLWTGNSYFIGLNEFFKQIESQTYKIQYRVLLSRYRGKTICPDCKGTRLRKDAGYVQIAGKSIQDVVLMSIDDALHFFQGLQLSEYEKKICKHILPEIEQRLAYLQKVGLGYLTLNRNSNTLSGGEAQRIQLATSIGSSLVGSLYILDEPSIGLHPRDTKKLIEVLTALKNQGNTVLVVEHEEEIMRAADEIIDIGPLAGSQGGNLVFQGNFAALQQSDSLTASYLTGRKQIALPQRTRTALGQLQIHNARQNNLKNLDVQIPLGQLVCVTGVSGSGKSTLIKRLLYPLVRKELGLSSDLIGKCNGLSGDIKKIGHVEFIDQNPIGKSSRSNPITYVKAFDDIREIYARQPLAKLRGYKPGYFSFNVAGGRCEICEGEGNITVSMQFMADVQLPCKHCKAKRYKSETLEIYYRNKSIADLLELTLQEALDFFSDDADKLAQRVAEKIQPLVDVGLGYLTVGQSSSTMSGGEAQRIKLASFLGKGNQTTPTLFIFDEPTTGLHFYDIEKLLIAFNALLDKGHSLVVIEHNMEVIKCADHIIDLGPDGGENGGNLLFAGHPKDFIQLKDNTTAQYLSEKLVEN